MLGSLFSCAAAPPTPGGEAVTMAAASDGLYLGPAGKVQTLTSMGLEGQCYVPDNLHNFFIDPKRKMLICATEKVGMQMFADLMCSIGKWHSPEDSPKTVMDRDQFEWEEGCDWHNAQACDPRSHNMNATMIEELLARPDWHKAMFYRDPLDRFLSGYKSKCEDGHDPDRWICEQVFGEQDATFDRAIATAASWDNTKALPPGKAFDHFRMQSDMCMGTLKRPNDFYDHVAKLETGSEDTREAVAGWMRSAGISDPEKEPAFRKHFPIEAVAQRSNAVLVAPEHMTHSDESRGAYYRSAMHVASIVHQYLPDYEVFNLTVPAWAAAVLAKADTSTALVAGSSNVKVAKPGDKTPCPHCKKAVELALLRVKPDQRAAPFYPPSADSVIVHDPPQADGAKADAEVNETRLDVSDHEGDAAVSQQAGDTLGVDGPQSVTLSSEPRLLQDPKVTPPELQVNGSCSDQVHRGSSMRIFGVPKLSACEDLSIATLMGSCRNYYSTGADGTLRLCFDQSPAAMRSSTMLHSEPSIGLDRPQEDGASVSSSSERQHKAESAAAAAAIRFYAKRNATMAKALSLVGHQQPTEPIGDALALDALTGTQLIFSRCSSGIPFTCDEEGRRWEERKLIDLAP